MYLNRLSLFLKQLLPPPWRQDWQYRLIRTLLLPLKALMEGFSAARQPDLKAAQGNMQIMPLRSALSALAGTPVQIEQRNEPFTFYIGLPRGAPERTKQRIRGYIETYRLSGTFYEFYTKP